LAVGDLDREIDPAIDHCAEAFEGGEQRLDPGQLGGPDVAGAAAHVVGVAELPVGSGLCNRVLVLLAEGTWAHDAARCAKAKVPEAERVHRTKTALALAMVVAARTRVGGDPAALDEAAVRGHVLHLKGAHHYSASSMRTVVAALRNFYGHLLGHKWRLFDLVSSPSPKILPAVLARAEVARLWSVLREERFRVILRLIYACGLRIGEAVNLVVRDLRGGEPGCPRLHLRAGKGQKDRLVPVPEVMLAWLRAWWKTHRHPRWLFPGLGRDGADGTSPATLAAAVEPMGVGSIQHCMRLAVAEAALPKGTCVHTLRHYVDKRTMLSHRRIPQRRPRDILGIVFGIRSSRRPVLGYPWSDSLIARIRLSASAGARSGDT